MNAQKVISTGIIGLIIAVLASMLMLNTMVYAQDAPVDEATPVTTQEEVVAETYNYVAQPGDSYTKMARKAVQTYGIESGTNLSGAQIVFTETNLTLAAGSPVLNEGQAVSIDKQLVADWATKASELTEAQQALWQPYADSVNFNTDNVGEVRE